MDLEEMRKSKVKVILQFSIPSIIAMVLTSMITIADGFFIGNYVGKEAIAAVNMGLPVLYVYLALGLMLSVGGVAIAGIALGAKQIDKCNAAFNQTMFTAAVCTLLFTVFIAIFFNPVAKLLQVNEQVYVYFAKYYRVLILELPIMVINSSFGLFIRGEGNPQYFMKVSILNVLSNIVLDYMAVRYFDLGVTGIAMASLLSALLEFTCILYFFWKKSKVFKISKFQFSVPMCKEMICNGSSEFIGEMSLGIAMFAYNFVIMKYVGIDGVAAFTVVGYASYVFSMIIVGFGQGASPLLSFTYGAREYEMCREIRKLTNLFVFLSGVGMILFMILCSTWYSHIFVKNGTVADMVYHGISIFVISFLFSGMNTITSFYFTSIGKAKESAVISSARGLIVLLICIFTLPMLLGMTGVWMVAPVTEIVTAGISYYFIRIEPQKAEAL